MIGQERGLFKLRGTLDSKLYLILQMGGFALLILIWYLLTAGEDPMVRTAILPRPVDVFTSYSTLLTEHELIKNTFRSIGLNIAGYVEAIITAVVFGFIVGLFPLFKGLFQRQVDAVRYVPLTAVIGIFITWFGIETGMKVHFLAFGIFIYLLPVVVQRIQEVDDVYLKTVYTLGATDWQTIKTVYVPSVFSRISDDIRVLTAISWTYIIIAEMMGSQGGIGALIWRVGQRQGRVDMQFALVILIVIIGVFQDKIFVNLDKQLFPHKYQAKQSYKRRKEAGILSMMLSFIWKALVWIFLVGYIVLLLNDLSGISGNTDVLAYLFGNTAWIIHSLVILILGYKIYLEIKQRRKRRAL